MYVLGFDIGGTKSAVILAKVRKDDVVFIKRGEYETISDWGKMLDVLSFEGKCFLEEYDINREECAIGISCGGPLDSRSGTILAPPNLPGWEEVHIVKYLQDKLGMPAYLKNDADACALAEWYYGAGRGTKHMIFLTFGTGLGAGLILNGTLYEGANGMAGEVGHIRMEESGPVGYGKAGSLEGFCSGGGIKQIGQSKAIELLAQGKRASFHKGSIDEITTKIIAEAAREGDEAAIEVFKKSGSYLGKGLSILIDILNPEMIVIGSIYARAKDLLIEAMENELKNETLDKSLKDCTIKAAELGEKIGDYGAVVAAMDAWRNN